MENFISPLRDRQLPPLKAGTSESQDLAEQPESPIRAVHDTSQIAQHVNLLVHQLQLLQEQLQQEWAAWEYNRQVHELEILELHNRSQQLEHILTPPVISEPPIPVQSAAAAPHSFTADDLILQATLAPDTAAKATLPPSGPINMGGNVKLDPPEPFPRKQKQDVDDWMDKTDLYFAMEIRLSPAQQMLRASLLLCKAASKWLRAMLKAAAKELSYIIQPQFREELRLAFHPPDYQFMARDRLSKVRNQHSVSGYTAAFHETYYACSDLLKADAVWQYIKNLEQSISAFVRTQFSTSLSSAIHAAARYESADKQAGAPPTGTFTPGSPALRCNPNYGDKGKQPCKGRGKQPKGTGPNYTPTPKHEPFSGNCNWCGKYRHKASHCNARKAGKPKQQPTSAQLTFGQLAALPPLPLLPPLQPCQKN